MTVPSEKDGMNCFQLMPQNDICLCSSDKALWWLFTVFMTRAKEEVYLVDTTVLSPLLVDRDLFIAVVFFNA